MFLPSWLKNAAAVTRARRANVRLCLEELERRNLPAIASSTVDVFTRFQDTVIDPAPVNNLLVSASQATVGPNLGPTVGRARAETAELVQSLSQTGGVAGTPGVTDRSSASSALSAQTSNYIVQGLPAGTTVALDVTMMLSGFLASQNFASLSANLSSYVQAQLTLTDAAGTQVVEGRALLSGGGLSTAGLLTLADFTPGPRSTVRTPHHDIDLTRTLPGAFTVTVGEVFSVEALLQTNGFVEGPFELFTTADFFTDSRGLSFTLDAPGATVVPFNDADLSLSRSGFVGEVIVGRTIEYTLSVTNNGPNAATDVTLTDSLHAGLSLVSVTPSQGSFTGDENTLVYALGNLLPGQTATVTVVAHANQVGTFDRSASVTATQPDTATSNNSVNVTTIVRPAFADLVVTVDDDQDPVRYDQPIPYTITVTNNGPDTATGVILEQFLLDGFFSSSSVEVELSANGDRLTMSLPDMAPGEIMTIFTRFFAPPGSFGTVQSTVSVSAFESDETPLDNADFEDTTVVSPPPSVYDFTIIAGGGVIAAPSINNAGTVAYRDNLTRSGLNEIQTAREQVSSATPPTTIAELTSRFEWFGLYQTINDAGTVAFVTDHATDETGRGIFIGNGGPLLTIADATGPLSRFGLSPSINNAGLVAFVASFEDIFDEGVFLGDGSGPPVLLADDTGDFLQFGHVTLNDLGQVAFHARLDNGGEGLYFWDGTTITTLVDDTGPFDNFTPRVSMNDSGAIAFAATLDNGDSGIFIIENGVIRTVVDSTGPYRDFGFACPAINNAGLVAFRAALDTGLTGIFTGPDPEADRVLVRGDPFFGRGVADMDVDWHGLNDAGQLAIWVRRDDGLTLIVRAELADVDSDGVLDIIERDAPGGGDGNGDGILDQRQRNVTSLPNAINGGYLTIVAPTGTSLVDVSATTAPVPHPVGASFPLGVIGFTVEDVAPGASVEVEVIAPGDLTSHQWFKQQIGWYPFGFDGTTGAQAVTDTIHGNPVTRFALTFVDGNARGDNDGMVDGRIVDPGGPALIAPTAIDVPIDIKPGKSGNRINLRSKGVLRVAILSTQAGNGVDAFDARAVDVTSIRFGDPQLSGRVAPIEHKLKDVNNDGLLDLIVQFSIAALRKNKALRMNSTEAMVTGVMQATTGGVDPFEGSDVVRLDTANKLAAHDDFFTRLGNGKGQSNRSTR